jgi:hypothetical protein
LKIYNQWLIIALFFLIGCNKQSTEKEFVLYTIKEGCNSSNSLVKLFKRDQIEFVFKFDSTAIYSTLKDNNQGDINKLFGFSDCGSKHHQNSARVGWRWFNNNLEVFAYCYNESEREAVYLATIEIGKEYNCRLAAIEGSYIFTLDQQNFKISRSCESVSNVKYYLFPYFGGNEPAPHNIYILIKEL